MESLNQEEVTMDFLPINIRISDARILIVGGGRVATHKATILSRFTDRATVIAPEVSDGIKSLPFQWVKRNFVEADLEGVTLLFVCTGNHPLNPEIPQLARKRGIQVRTNSGTGNTNMRVFCKKVYTIGD